MPEFNPEVAVTVYLVLQFLWLVGALLAAHDGFLTVRQMKENHGSRGIPYIHHYGLWNDLLVVHPLCAVLTGFFAANWIAEENILSFLAVVAGCGIMSYAANRTWVEGPMLQSQGYENQLMWAGRLHVIQMGLIVFVLIMSVITFSRLWGDGTMPWAFFLGTVSLVLAHVCMGWHWPLRVLNPEWNPFPDGESGGVLAYLYVLLTIGSTGCFFLQLYPNVFQH